MQKNIYYRKRRIKPKPKYGKYLYEYIINFENGFPVSVRGKNKYLIVYKHNEEYLSVSKSNGLIALSPSYKRRQEAQTFQEIQEYLNTVRDGFSREGVYCRSLFSLDNISHQKLEEFIKNGDKQRRFEFLENQIRKKQLNLERIKEEEKKIRDSIGKIEKEIQALKEQKGVLEVWYGKQKNEERKTET